MSCSTLRNSHLPRHSEFEHSIVTSDLGPTTLFTTLEPQHFAAIWGFREMDHSSRSFGTRNSAIFFLFFSIAFGIETCQVRMVGLALHVESGVVTIWIHPPHQKQTYGPYVCFCWGGWMTWGLKFQSSRSLFGGRMAGFCGYMYLKVIHEIKFGLCKRYFWRHTQGLTVIVFSSFSFFMAAASRLVRPRIQVSDKYSRPTVHGRDL